MKAFVYRNLHRGCFSVRFGGKVKQHEDSVALTDAEFRVQPAGQRRVLRTGKKNVHAFVVGRVDSGSECPDRPPDGEAWYNPKEVACFVDTATKKPLKGTFRFVLLEMLYMSGDCYGSRISYWR